MADILQSKMIFRTTIMTEFKGTKLNGIDSVSVGNQSAYKTLLDGKVYEFINTVKFGDEFPAMLNPWTPIILTKEWAQSFAKAVNDTPKPLFIGGHASQGVHPKERAIPDGYITGAMVNGDALYLRNSLPEGGTETKRALVEQTMKEISAKMLSTSTEDVIAYKIVVNPDDTYDETYFAIESLNGQGNALVEADQKGSAAEIILTSFKADNGHDEKQGEKQMGEQITNVDRFTSLKNQLDSGSLALKDVASGLGIEVMTLKQKDALKRLNDVESKVGGNIEEYVINSKAMEDTTFTALKDAKIKEVFKSDELVEVASGLFQLKDGDAKAIDAEVVRLSDLAIFKTLQGKVAASINFAPTGEGNTEAGALPEVMEG